MLRVAALQVAHAQAPLTGSRPTSPVPSPAAVKPAADPAGSLHAVLASSAPRVRALLDIIALRPTAVPKGAVGTFFAPNDAVRMESPGAITFLILQTYKRACILEFSVGMPGALNQVSL